uniref:DUF1501 domain-containing protein n=1 Tax=Roseihalotalea indica TaxID=2867963 RepID=A0AA49GK63_9BACT|nr:DUF1501 domain-containing protein [Tunicatimonas sp. TK19036]
MNRRSFLKKAPVAASTPLLLNGLSLRALAEQSPIQQLAASSANDRVLVIIQLHGGNDGLNALIPINQYSRYYDLRPNIAIADKGSRGIIQLDNTLADEQQLGLHPDMLGMKELYDEGQMAIVQSVAYDNINGSHFRSRDIWFMGGDYDEYMDSAWMGRYLDQLFPGYPNQYPNDGMPDPLGIEIGNSVSLAFHRDNGIPTSIAINNPEQFYNLINSVGVDPPESVADTYYGHELQWILDIEKKSNQYAGRLRELYEKGRNSAGVQYPEKYPLNAPAQSVRNGLAPQLKMIARLLSGGIKTKIFLARIGGFDTHASQVEAHDASMGVHAALLYHISEAMKAFQADLKNLGLDNRVMTVTMSEFGRRAKSNGSYGTDHGTAAPMFVFGRNVKPSVVGANPDLSNLNRNNLRHQFDYRQVFGSLVQDWMLADSAALDRTGFNEFLTPEKKITLVGDPVTSVDSIEFARQRYYLRPCSPNPAEGLTQIQYRINAREWVQLEVLNSMGNTIQTIVNQTQTAGEYTKTIDVTDWPTGAYIVSIKTTGWQETTKLIVV